MKLVKNRVIKNNTLIATKKYGVRQYVKLKNIDEKDDKISEFFFQAVKFWNGCNSVKGAVKGGGIQTQWYLWTMQKDLSVEL